jgi:hypothetical protein
MVMSWCVRLFFGTSFCCAAMVKLGPCNFNYLAFMTSFGPKELESNLNRLMFFRLSTFLSNVV